MKRNILKKIIIIILIISIISLITLVIHDLFQKKKIDKELKDIVKNFDIASLEIDKSPVVENEYEKKDSIVIDGLNVYGKINIKKINIEYPIIEYVNDDSLWKSVCKISDNKIDGTGNLCIAGHNMRNETMFTRLKELEIGDKIEIINVSNEKFIYEVFEKVEVNENRTDVLNNTEESILTLITCKSLDYTKRVIVKGKLIE